MQCKIEIYDESWMEHLLLNVPAGLAFPPLQTRSMTKNPLSCRIVRRRQLPGRVSTLSKEEYSTKIRRFYLRSLHTTPLFLCTPITKEAIVKSSTTLIRWFGTALPRLLWLPLLCAFGSTKKRRTGCGHYPLVKIKWRRYGSSIKSINHNDKPAIIIWAWLQREM